MVGRHWVLTQETKDRQSKARKGIVFSEETRRKMSLAKIGKKQPKELVAQRVKSNTGKKRTKEQCENISRSLAGKPLSKAHKEKISINTKNAWANGIFNNRPVNVKTIYGNPTIYRGIQMRSKIETRCAALLDSMSIIWQYEPKRFNLSLDGTTYCPDFYLPEFDIWLEVKWTKSYKRFPQLYKVDLLRKTGKLVTIVTHNEIKELELCHTSSNVVS